MVDRRSSGPRGLGRRAALAGFGAAAGLTMLGRRAAAAPVKIRYATGGGIGPNEMETVIFLDYLKQNVLQHFGKAYTLDITFTRGTPEAATLLAAGQADMATLSFAAFAISTLKGAIAGGVRIVSDNFQDGRDGYASNSFVVLKESPIQKVPDLKGKKVAINAFGSAVDLALRVVLKKHGLDPRRDLEIVEIAFPNIASAVRERRVDCGAMIIPFMPPELAKGDLRTLFTGGDAFGPHCLLFQVVTNDFVAANREAVRAFLDDYVRGLHWFYDPANRAKAVELTADFTKTSKDALDGYFMTAKDYYRDINGCVASSLIQSPIDAMLGERLIEAPVDVAKYVDTSLLPMPCKA